MNQESRQFKLSFIIISKNEEQNIKMCIDSINENMKNNQLEYEIILVDSNSNDRTVEIAKNMKNVRVIQISKSTFYSAAFSRNIGSDYSMGDYLCFLDGDMVLKKNFIELALETIVSEKLAGCIGKRKDLHLDENGDVEFEVDNVYKIYQKKIADHFGGSLLIDKKAFVDSGKFTSHLVASEEPELYLRLKKKKYQIAELPIDMIDHYVRKDKSKTILQYFTNRRSMGIGQVIRVAVESKIFKEVVYHKPLRTFILPFLIDLICLIFLPVFMINMNLLMAIIFISQLMNFILSGGTKKYLLNKLLIPGTLMGLFYKPEVIFELYESQR